MRDPKAGGMHESKQKFCDDCRMQNTNMHVLYVIIEQTVGKFTEAVYTYLSNKWSKNGKNSVSTELLNKWYKYCIYKGVFKCSIIPYLPVDRFIFLQHMCTQITMHEVRDLAPRDLVLSPTLSKPLARSLFCTSRLLISAAGRMYTSFLHVRPATTQDKVIRAVVAG